MKKVSLLVFLLVILTVNLLFATQWAIVVNSDRGSTTDNNSISMIKLDNGNQVVYGPFLTGQLGSDWGGLFDVAVTPDNKYALISNFGESTIYRVNISNPTNPVLAGSIQLSFFAEDIAIAPNGQFAVVTDGGFDSSYALINMNTFTLTLEDNLTNSYAQAVAIAADSRTIAFVDYFTDNLTYGIIDANTGLVTENMLSLGEGSRPVNLAISPDGRTIITANVGDNSTSVFNITSPGVVVPGSTPKLTELPGRPQSVAFSPNGQLAYVFSTSVDPDNLSITYRHVSVFYVTGPGSLVYSGRYSTSAGSSGSILFGVDTMAVSPSGSSILFTNPAYSGATENVTIVNAQTLETSTIPTNYVNAGIATFGETKTTDVPTLSEWGMIIFALIAGFIGFRKTRKSINSI